ncbi:MAG: riboflavin synthase [Polyangiaceae bacterium]|nr:riboflavin synthase [Polyangiaceae bacterium]
MFTGLVETTGELRSRSGSPVARALIEARFNGALVLGESISVNGVCLTVDAILPNGFVADISAETLARTTLGELLLGSKVHLERATPAGGRLGGHIVSGHVDGVGKVVERKPSGSAIALSVSAPVDLAPFIATKGSVAVDGVSLTVNRATGPERTSDVVFDLMLVPHTLGVTFLADLRPGDRVNVEVDLLARYVARRLEFQDHPAKNALHGEPHDDERILQKLRTSGYL